MSVSITTSTPLPNSTAPPPVSSPPRGVTLMIDNYDSFTYNIVQYLSQLGAHVVTYRNDELTVKDALLMDPVNVVISPGPGAPAEAGISKDIIQAFAGKVPVLGVCLGHQSIIELYGGEIVRCNRIMHGKVSKVCHDARGVFAGLSSTGKDKHADNHPSVSTFGEQEPMPFTASLSATRYHSLVGKPESLPESLIVTAYTEEAADGCPTAVTIMGVRHKQLTVEGVQFHPESVTTESGMQMLSNFLKLRGGQWETAFIAE